MQARLHEQVKTRQTLVSMTVCMICAILSKPEELNLKAPVAMLTSRSIFHLVERYRLTTLLRLQWANLVCSSKRAALWFAKTCAYTLCRFQWASLACCLTATVAPRQCLIP